jgi:hypothetical protein
MLVRAVAQIMFARESYSLQAQLRIRNPPPGGDPRLSYALQQFTVGRARKS